MDFHKKNFAFQKLEVYGTDPVIIALIFLKTFPMQKLEVYYCTLSVNMTRIFI